MKILAPSKNVQKQRKANPKVELRQNVYWDLRGRYQEEYDKRLDRLPESGKGATKADEIFRAATKLYYDFWNNAMVNNTSGAVCFLLNVGVFASAQDEDFVEIHPYTIGSRVYLDEADLRFTMERVLDRTITFLLAHDELDAQTNDIDYLDFSQPFHMSNYDRCTTRNNHFLQMKENAVVVDVVVEGEDTKALRSQDSMKAQDCKKKKKKRVPSAKNLINIMNSFTNISKSKK